MPQWDADRWQQSLAKLAGLFRVYAHIREFHYMFVISIRFDPLLKGLLLTGNDHIRKIWKSR